VGQERELEPLEDLGVVGRVEPGVHEVDVALRVAKRRVHGDLPQAGELEAALADVGLLEAVVGDAVVERVGPEGVRAGRVGERRARHRRVVLCRRERRKGGGRARQRPDRSSA